LDSIFSVVYPYHGLYKHSLGTSAQFFPLFFFISIPLLPLFSVFRENLGCRISKHCPGTLFRVCPPEPPSPPIDFYIKMTHFYAFCTRAGRTPIFPLRFLAFPPVSLLRRCSPQLKDDSPGLFPRTRSPFFDYEGLPTSVLACVGFFQKKTCPVFLFFFCESQPLRQLSSQRMVHPLVYFLQI